MLGPAACSPTARFLLDLHRHFRRLKWRVARLPSPHPDCRFAPPQGCLACRKSGAGFGVAVRLGLSRICCLLHVFLRDWWLLHRSTWKSPAPGINWLMLPWKP